MYNHKSEDYKLSAVEYYLTEDKTQEEVCKIFKCSARSLGVKQSIFHLVRIKR